MVCQRGSGGAEEVPRADGAVAEAHRQRECRASACLTGGPAQRRPPNARRPAIRAVAQVCRQRWIAVPERVDPRSVAQAVLRRRAASSVAQTKPECPASVITDTAAPVAGTVSSTSAHRACSDAHIVAAGSDISLARSPGRAIGTTTQATMLHPCMSCRCGPPFRGRRTRAGGEQPPGLLAASPHPLPWSQTSKPNLRPAAYPPVAGWRRRPRDRATRAPDPPRGMAGCFAGSNSGPQLPPRRLLHEPKCLRCTAYEIKAESLSRRGGQIHTGIVHLDEDNKIGCAERQAQRRASLADAEQHHGASDHGGVVQQSRRQTPVWLTVEHQSAGGGRRRPHRSQPNR